jgi:hypothetical protein
MYFAKALTQLIFLDGYLYATGDETFSLFIHKLDPETLAFVPLTVNTSQWARQINPTFDPLDNNKLYYFSQLLASPFTILIRIWDKSTGADTLFTSGNLNFPDAIHWDPTGNKKFLYLKSYITL